jgi:hypothetical protein
LVPRVGYDLLGDAAVAGQQVDLDLDPIRYAPGEAVDGFGLARDDTQARSRTRGDGVERSVAEVEVGDLHANDGTRFRLAEETGRRARSTAAQGQEKDRWENHRGWVTHG